MEYMENGRELNIENGIKGEADVLGLSESHLLGQGMTEGDSGGECSAWESLKGGVVKIKITVYVSV